MDLIRATDIEAGTVIQTDSWKATALWVHHAEPWLNSLMYRFDTEQGSVLFTGDGGACEALTEACSVVDTLVICCAYIGDTHADIGHVVTGVPAVTAIAEKTGASRIILTHQNAGITSPDARERALAEIGKSYSGEVIFGDELTSLQI
jgi:ribonuclease BN (tRNA processing enzyme)